MLIKYITKRAEKKYNNEKDKRTYYGFFSSVLGISVNIILFAVKFTFGLITNSISLTADSINNLSDSATAIVSFVGFKISSKPADKKHPFGHGRTEYISSLIVAFIILIIGYELIRDSFDRILHPTSLTFNFLVMGILVLTIITKLWLSYFYSKMSKKIQSQVLKTASADSLNDVWATGSVFVSFIVFYFSGYVIDGYMGILVSVLIMYNGISFIRESLDTIIGDKTDENTINKISQFVSSYSGIINVHDIIVHDYGPISKIATAHVEISSDLSLLVAHEIIDRIELGMKEELGISLLLHMDPIEVNCPLTNNIKEEIVSILKTIEGISAIHDFRVIEEGQNSTVFFQINLDENVTEDEFVFKDKTLEILRKKLPYKFIVNIKKDNLFLY